jgi:excisionase family DNA binding protein
MTTTDSHPPNGSWETTSLLTVPEVAEWVRVHRKTVYRWIHDGRLEALRFGPRTFRIPVEAVNLFLQQAGYGNIPHPARSNGREHDEPHHAT